MLDAILIYLCIGAAVSLLTAWIFNGQLRFGFLLSIIPLWPWALRDLYRFVRRMR